MKGSSIVYCSLMILSAIMVFVLVDDHAKIIFFISVYIVAGCVDMALHDIIPITAFRYINIFYSIFISKSRLNKMLNTIFDPNKKL